MKLALFTNRFPSRGDTFFARDIRSLQEAGLSVDVFPIYPEDLYGGCVNLETFSETERDPRV